MHKILPHIKTERQRWAVKRFLRRLVALAIMALVGFSILLLYVLSWPIGEFTAIELVGYFGAVVVNLAAIRGCYQVIKAVKELISEVNNQADE